MNLRALSFALVCVLTVAAYSADKVADVPRKGPIADAADATARAIVFANREAKSLDLKPFTEKSAAAKLVGAKWIWRARVGQGKGDVEITVVLRKDGTLESCTSKQLVSTVDRSRF